MTNWKSVPIWLGGIVAPLLFFYQLALRLPDNLPGDEPILLAIHKVATPDLDIWVGRLTQLGGFTSVLVGGGVIALGLAVIRQWSALLYLLVTLLGAGLLNRLAKVAFHRPRPQLWQTPTETDFSFPSGHAMASMTLVIVLLTLSWQRRWFWPVVVVGVGFVLVIAGTRLYLGVHYPSDILAGWLLALAWAIAARWLLSGLLDQTSAAHSSVSIRDAD